MLEVEIHYPIPPLSPTASHHSSSHLEFEIHKEHMKTFSWETFKQYAIILPIEGNGTLQNDFYPLSLEAYSRWQPNECVRSVSCAAESLGGAGIPLVHWPGLTPIKHPAFSYWHKMKCFLSQDRRI